MAENLRKVRSWHGLTGEIGVGNRLWHLVKVGYVPLPHPPLVNLVLRKGLPLEEHLQLSFLHEFGHLQTFPLVILHAGFLIVFGYWRSHGLGAFLRRVIAGAVAHEAVWELSSEAYAKAKAGPEYRRIYREYPNPFGQFLFWGGMTTLAVFASLYLIRPGNSTLEKVSVR